MSTKYEFPHFATSSILLLLHSALDDDIKMDINGFNCSTDEILKEECIPWSWLML
jgi:hypothetical protein